MGLTQSRPAAEPGGAWRKLAAAMPAAQPHARFLATMSHELRTPLNVVIGCSDALMQSRDPAPSRDEVIDYATSINQAGRQLLALIDVILDISRIEADGGMPSDLMDVGHLISAAVAQAAEAAQAGQLTLHSETSPGVPLLRGDERRIRQVLAQMLSNAVKFTPRGGSVRIAARLEPRTGALLLLVSDTGIGIAAEDIPRAFEAFVQLDSRHARRFGGSGLGLYVGRLIARAHGGDLILSSKLGRRHDRRAAPATGPPAAAAARHAALTFGLAMEPS